MQRIQVFEWESLRVGIAEPEQPAITPRQFEELVVWQEAQGQTYFQIGHNRIVFTQWVGVIQTTDLSIEVLPKAESRASNVPRSSLVEKWSGILLHMVSNAMDIDLRLTDQTKLHVRDHTLIDLFHMLLVREVETLIHQGLVKRYHKETEQRTSLKGRLDLTKQLRHNYIHRERFYTHAQEYDTFHPLNQILLAALRTSARTARSFGVSSLAQNLVHCFPDWPTQAFTTEDFDRLIIDRKSDGYQGALTLSRLILLRLAPQIQAGHSSVVGLFFDMNVLWEEWLRHLFDRLFLNYPEKRGKWLGKRGKRQSKFWQSSGYGKWVETDLLFEWSGDCHVLDAKWKLLQDGRPSDNDLRQMFVYGVIHQAKNTGLVYPSIGQNDVAGYFYEQGGPAKMDLLFIPPTMGRDQSGCDSLLKWLNSTTQRVPG